MEGIYSLIGSLTKGEWQSLQSYLRCFSSHSPSELKQLQLAELLRNAEECPEATFCCVKIYGIKSDISFEVLKARLKEKTLDFLLTDISTDKRDELDEADYAIIKMKKRSAQFQQLFYSKKRIPFIYGLLDEIIFLAKEYEQYSILLDHLRLEKMLISWRAGDKSFEKINEKINIVWQVIAIYYKAEHYYGKLMMLNDFSGKFDKHKTLLDLKEKIAEVRDGYELTNSPMVHYYLKNLEMGYYQIAEDHLQARSVCLELLNIVRNNKSVYRRQRLGVAYDNLSRCEFYLGNLEEAARCAREGQVHFNEASENYCIAIEQEFYAQFALEQYSQSTALVNKMMASATRKELGEFRFSKYNYLLANTLFMQRKFDGVKAILSEEREISSDKAGWETGARILSIMTLIEMQKLDEASLAIFGLKQFFKRVDKKTMVSKRDKTILNLLLILERAGFAFGLLNGSAQKHLVTLASHDEKTRWEPFTPELVPFHKWFAEKMNKTFSESVKETPEGSKSIPFTPPSLSQSK